MTDKQTDLVKLTTGENEFIAELIKGRKEDAAIAVPDDMPPRDVLVAVRACASTLNKLEKAHGFVAPVLGRLMAIVSRDKLYQQAGYDTLGAYEEAELSSKISHATLWNAKRAYEVFPELPLATYAEIGTSNINLASKHAKGKSDKQKKEIIEKAAKLPPAKFQTWIEGESGISSPGENDGAEYILTGNRTQISELKEWLKDPRFEQAAEAKQPIELILAAIHSFSAEWPHLEGLVIPTTNTVHVGVVLELEQEKGEW